MRHLHQLASGETAIIQEFADLGLASRLISMGVLPGQEIKMVRHSFTGASCIVQLKALTLALRQSEAAGIIVS
jgi:ferrous iron transport protein A